MLIEKHDFHHEFTEYYDRTYELKASNSHFVRLFNEYHDINREIRRIEEGVENSSNEYIEELKKKRLLYKDKLYGMIANLWSHLACNKTIIYRLTAACCKYYILFRKELSRLVHPRFGPGAMARPVFQANCF